MTTQDPLRRSVYDVLTQNELLDAGQVPFDGFVNRMGDEVFSRAVYDQAISNSLIDPEGLPFEKFVKPFTSEKSGDQSHKFQEKFEAAPSTRDSLADRVRYDAISDRMEGPKEDLSEQGSLERSINMLGTGIASIIGGLGGRMKMAARERNDMVLVADPKNPDREPFPLLRSIANKYNFEIVGNYDRDMDSASARFDNLLASGGERLTDVSEDMVERFEYESAIENFEWGDLATLEGWKNMPSILHEGVLVSLPEMLLTLAAAGPAGAAAGKLTTASKGVKSLARYLGPRLRPHLERRGLLRPGASPQELNAAVLSTLGTAASTTTIGFGQAAGTGILESGRTYNEMIELGVDEYTAAEEAGQVFWDNLALGAVNAMQFGVYRQAFTGQRAQMGKLRRTGTGLLTVGSEGVQEVYQDGASMAAINRALGESDMTAIEQFLDLDHWRSNDAGRAFIGGVAGGFGMKGGSTISGRVIRSFQNDKRNVNSDLVSNPVKASRARIEEAIEAVDAELNELMYEFNKKETTPERKAELEADLKDRELQFNILNMALDNYSRTPQSGDLVQFVDGDQVVEGKVVGVLPDGRVEIEGEDGRVSFRRDTDSYVVIDSKEEGIAAATVQANLGEQIVSFNMGRSKKQGIIVEDLGDGRVVVEYEQNGETRSTIRRNDKLTPLEKADLDDIVDLAIIEESRRVVEQEQGQGQAEQTDQVDLEDSAENVDADAMNEELMGMFRREDSPVSEKTSALTLVHYSRQPGLTELNPDYEGTGVRGQATRNGAPDVKVTYFYRADTKAERMVISPSTTKYTVDASGKNLYDLGRDSELDGFAQKVRDENNGAFNRDELLKRVKSAGYDGFFNSAAGRMDNVVALFNPQQVSSESPISLQEKRSRDVRAPQSEAALMRISSVTSQLDPNTRKTPATQAKEKAQQFSKDHPEAVKLEFVADKDGNPKIKDGSLVYKTVPLELQKGTDKYVSKDYSRAVEILADKLSREIDSVKNDPAIMKAMGWYSDTQSKIQKALGGNTELFAQLLGATSARTPVAENFSQAREALELFSAGKYDKLLQRYDAYIKDIDSKSDAQLLEMWRAENNKKANPARESTFRADDFRRKLINRFDGVPKKRNGKKFNANSDKVLQALYGNWVQQTLGPKTPNFSGNLSGRSADPTIDVWAARTLRRAIYDGAVKKWRVTPRQEAGVTFTRNPKTGELGGDYRLAMDVMSRVADIQGMTAPDTQAVLWFHEKKIWEQNKWTEGEGAELSSFEDNLSAIEGDRYQAGITTHIEGQAFNPEAFAKAQQELNEAIRSVDGLIALRNVESEGGYSGEGSLYTEPSMDVEFTVKKGADVTAVREAVNKIGQEHNQHSVLFSQVVDADHENARPLIEVGLREPGENVEAIREVQAVLEKFGVGGFTIAKDNKGRVSGIRFQYVPEFEGDSQAQQERVLDFKNAFEVINDSFSNHEAISYIQSSAVDTEVIYTRKKNERNNESNDVEQGVPGEISGAGSGDGSVQGANTAANQAERGTGSDRGGDGNVRRAGQESDSGDGILRREPARVTTDPDTPLTEGGFRNAVDDFTRRYSVETDVLQSEDQLPKRLQRQIKEAGQSGKIVGLYDPATDRVYIIQRDGVTARDLANTLIHESMHFGLRRFNQGALNTLLDDVWSSISARKSSDSARQLLEKIIKDYGIADADVNENSRRLAAEELISFMSEERSILTDKPMFRTVIDALKNFFNGIVGLDKSMMTDADIFAAISDVQSELRAENGFTPKGIEIAHRAARMQRRTVEGPALDKGLIESAKELTDALGIVLRQGGTYGKDARLNKKQTNVVRTKSIADFSAIVGKVGESLLSKQPLNVERGSEMHLQLQVWAEGIIPAESIKEMSPNQLMSRLTDGLTRTFVENPQHMSKNYPEIYSQMNDHFDSMGVLGILDEASSSFDAYHSAPAQQKTTAAIVTPKSKGLIQKVKDRSRDGGVRDGIRQIGSSIYTKLLSSYNPIEIAVKDLRDRKIAEKNGERFDIKASEDPYKLARLTADSFSRGQLDIDAGVAPYRSTQGEGVSLTEAVQKALGKNFTDENVNAFGTYLTARRMIQEWERFNRGEIKNRPHSNSAADWLITMRELEQKFPAFKDAAPMIYEWTGNLWQKAYDAGFLGEDLYNSGRERQGYYVPLMRDMSDKVTDKGTGKASNNNRGVSTRRFEGSDRNIINPLVSLMEMSFKLNNRIAVNDAVKSFATMVRGVQRSGDIAELVPMKTMRKFQVDPTEMIKQLDEQMSELGADMDSSFLDILGESGIELEDMRPLTAYRTANVTPDGKRLVTWFENGEMKGMLMGDDHPGLELYGAFKQLDGSMQDQFGAIVNAVAKPASYLRAGITTEPTFFFANLIRDQLAAWTLTDVGYVPFVDFARGIKSELTQDEAYQMYRRMSGLSSVVMEGLSKGHVDKAVKSLETKNILLRNMKGATKFNLRALGEITALSESGTRIGLFKKAYRDAKKRGMTDQDAMTEAAYITRDYIDFSRSGSSRSVQAIRKAVTFLNVGIQSLDKAGRTITADGEFKRVMTDYLKGNEVAMTEGEKRKMRIAYKMLGKMTMMGLAGLALSMNYEDDPEFQEISKSYVRNTHWVVKLTDGHWVSIPKPFELGVFSNIFESAYESTKNENPEWADEMKRSIWDSVGFPLLPPALKVPMELYFNEDTNSGRPVVPRNLEGLDMNRQFNDYTSSLSKTLGPKIGVSPMKLDHMIKGWTGTWGRTVLGLLNEADPTAPEPNWYDMYFVRRFIKSPDRGSESRSKIYESVGNTGATYDTFYRSFLHDIETGNQELAGEYLGKLPRHAQEYVALKFDRRNTRGRFQSENHPLDETKLNLDFIAQFNREIREADDITPAEKREIMTYTNRFATETSRNALIACGVPGYTNRPFSDHEDSLEKFRDNMPAYFNLFMSRSEEANRRLGNTNDLRSYRQRRESGEYDRMINDFVEGRF